MILRRYLRFAPAALAAVAALTLAACSLGDEYHVDTMEIASRLTGHTGPVTDVGIEPDGELTVTTGADAVVRVWNTREGTVKFELTGHEFPICALGMSLPGPYAVTADAGGNIKVWNINTGTLAMSIADAHHGPIHDAVFAPDGQTVVTAGQDGVIRVWSTGTESLLKELGTHDAPATCVAVGYRGKVLATGDSAGVVKTWDAISGEETGRFETHDGAVRDIAISMDGKYLGTVGADNRAVVRLLYDDTIEHDFSGSKGLSAVTFSPNSSTLVTADDEGNVGYWDMRDGTYGRTLEGHTAAVTSIDIAHSAEFLVTGSEDGTAIIWQARN